jgi:hypothetical protein
MMVPYPSTSPSTIPTISAPVDTTGMIVGGVAIGALSIASAFALFQFMRRGSGPGPASETKSTPVTEAETLVEKEPETEPEEGSETGSIVESETIIELEPRPFERRMEAPPVGISERLPERPIDSPSLGLSIGPLVGPLVGSKLTSESSTPLTYLSIDPAHVDEITQFLAALKKRG